MKKHPLKFGLGADFKAGNRQAPAPRRAAWQRHVLPLLAIPIACGLAYFSSLEFAAFWLTVTIAGLYFAASIEQETEETRD